MLSDAMLSDGPWPRWLADALAAEPGGVVVVAAILLGLGMLFGTLAARAGRTPARPDPPVTARPDPRIAALEAELAAARAMATRQQDDADAGVQAFCAILAPTLSALSDAAEQGRSAAAECAAQADAMHAAMQDAAEDSGQTAATLAAVVAHADSLALSMQAIAAALGAVAEAIGPELDGHDSAAPHPGQSLVQLAAQASAALSDLVGTLHTTAQSADAIAQRVAAVRDAAAAGSAAAQTMAHATETAGRGAVTVGLEFASFLDGLSRAGNRRKFDRYPTDLGATIIVNGTEHTVRIVDVSRGGCAMDGDPGLETGTSIVIRLPGVDDIAGRVARRLGSITGLEFTEGDPLAGKLETLIVARAEVA
jgi:methyl-accepting chemotaxis protein